MKLTPNLKAVILKSFKAGETIDYMAHLYGISVEKIEQLIRKALWARDDKPDKPVVDDAGGALGEEKQ